MELRDNVRLDAVSWFESLARLSAWSASGAPIENVLRLSYHLAALAPPPFGTIAACTLDEAAFDAMLERQAFEAAAVSLIGTALSYEVVANAGTDQATVRVWLDNDGEVLMTSDTLALALARAWLAFMLNLNQATGSSHNPA